MIEQQKRKGPELPLVPVKRQRHELLLGAAGSGPGAGQQQGTPGALLQAVSEEAGGLRPSARLRLLLALVPDDPALRGENAPAVKTDRDSKSDQYPVDVPHVFACLRHFFYLSTAL